jgi:hypothetical protein
MINILAQIVGVKVNTVIVTIIEETKKQTQLHKPEDLITPHLTPHRLSPQFLQEVHVVLKINVYNLVEKIVETLVATIWVDPAKPQMDGILVPI